MVPSYFCPMLLCDPSRTKLYQTAIENAIESFEIHNNRSPRVLDLGCGTGLLGVLTLRCGAESVVSVDINDECVEMTREVARKWQGIASWEVVHADELDPNELYDMIVTEMMGTMVFSEDMKATIDSYTKYLDQSVRGGPYVIPKSAQQYVSKAVLPDGWLRTALGRVMCDDAFVGTNSINMHPACCDVRLSDKACVYEADFAIEDGETLHDVHVECDGRTLLFCEWSCRLWGDVWLHNTIQEYRCLTLGNAMGRECAWGFAIASPPIGIVRLSIDSSQGEPKLKAQNGDWCIEGISEGTESLAFLLPSAHEEAVRSAVDAIENSDVLVETTENAAIVPFLEELCASKNLEEPWLQDDISRSWSMKNQILKLGCPVDEPPADESEATLGLALLPDFDGERVSELACRYNDDRFANEKPTQELAAELLKSFGGDPTSTNILPNLQHTPIEWKHMVLPVQDPLVARAMAAPLTRMQGYASLTRHGMSDKTQMPGNNMQSLPLLLTTEDVPGIPVLAAVATHLPQSHEWNADDDTRSLVSCLCRGGAALVLRM